MPTDRADLETTTPNRRWRVDDTVPPALAGPAPRSTVSGRRAVVALVSAVLILWFVLNLAFREWRAGYQARAQYGATHVAPVVDPLANLEPPGVVPLEWRRAVSDTHAMLLALTGSGLLGESQMDDLRRDIAAQVANARPETAQGILAAIWDDLERKAGPVIAPDRTDVPLNPRHAARHPRPARPKILGPSVKVPVGRLED